MNSLTAYSEYLVGICRYICAYTYVCIYVLILTYIYMKLYLYVCIFSVQGTYFFRRFL